MELISYLKADQKNIRRLLKDMDSSESIQLKRELFNELSDLLDAHFKAEELAVYTSSLKKPMLSDFAIKGFEEHNLLEDLLCKIKFSNDQDFWESQLNVFCQVLDMHLKEEETEFFPQIKKNYKAVESDRAAVLYLKIKKSEGVKNQQSKKYKIEKEIQLAN